MRLSGDKALIDNTKKPAVALTDSPAFREAHPAIVGFLEEFGQYSEVVSPVLFGARQLESIEEPHCVLDPYARPRALPSNADEEPWQAYLASRGLRM